MIDLQMLFKIIFTLASCSIAVAKSEPSLPIVDLGYDLHQASSLSVSIHVYSCTAFAKQVTSQMEVFITFQILDTASRQLVISDFVRHVHLVVGERL